MARVGVGIDIGTRGVTVAQLERRGDGLVLTAALRLSRPTQVDEYAIEPETVADLAANLRSAGIPVSGAVLGLSGRDLILRYTQVPPVPDWRLKMLMEFEIGELAGKSGGDVASDYTVLAVPEDSGGNRTAVVGLAKVEGLDARLGSLTAAKLPPPDACPASLGLFHSVLASGAAKEGETLLVLDIGARNTEMVICRGDTLLFARNLSNGGDQFTQALADALSVPFEEADGIKEKEGDVTPMRAMRAKNERHEQVLSALGAAASQYAAMLQSSLMFAKAQTRMAELAPSRVLVAGGGSRLKGFKDFLRNSLKTPVDTFEPLANIDVELGDPELAQAIGSIGREMAVALGLARLALREPGPRLTLLPPRVQRRRAFFRQKLFLWGGGAAAALAFIVGLVGAVRDLDAVEAGLGDVNSDKKQATANADEIKSIRAETAVAQALHGALARETAPGQALVRVLRAIQAVAPAELYIDELYLRPEGEIGAMGRGAKIEIDGQVTQGEEQAQDVLTRFCRALEGWKDEAGPVCARATQSKMTPLPGGGATWKIEVELLGLAAPPVEKPADPEND